MKARVPAAAPATPPETGASIARCPACTAFSWAARASATSMVELSTNRVFGRAADRTSSYSFSTRAPLGSMVITTSASRTASVADSTIVSPSARPCSWAAGTGS